MPDPGPNYAKLMEEYTSRRQNKLPTQIITIPDNDKETNDSTMIQLPEPIDKELNDLEVVYYAYKFFEIFKGLVVDSIFSFHERNMSRKFFKEREAEDALG
ncbi:hypothetical protein CCACVL1_17293 [Corchorus capsularis]|uniref:DUF4220 domain-containing protein n=1 Tax=Corchorus capsularis TaxID=210143 RepID=A0A1R3HT33_COCAP|nr:hypothetical protein CCACVL1_17293 [Corchorus capsularis]